MKQVILLHNPGAGDENHVQDDIIKEIEQEGFGCTYFSVKEDKWSSQLDKADFLVIAGGDGTVRKVTKELLKRNVLEKQIPLAILPMGTANNLSKNFGVKKSDDLTRQIKSWHSPKFQKFDVGVINNSNDFFLESFGLGVFPDLMKEMKVKEKQKENLSAEEELSLALKTFKEILLSYNPVNCELIFNGKTVSGKYLLVEVMNIKTIGPNLLLAPNAITDDGKFNVAVIEESEKDDFAKHIEKRISNEPSKYNYKNYMANKLQLNSDAPHMHTDDELILPYKNPIDLNVRKEILDFIV